MKYIAIIMLVGATSCYPMEIANHRKAEFSLAKQGTDVDTEKGLLFGYSLGTRESDIYEKLGSPSAVIRLEKEVYLYYGINKAFIISDGILKGVLVGYNLLPEPLRNEEDSHLDDQTKRIARWSVDGLKYHDSASKFLSIFNKRMNDFDVNSMKAYEFDNNGFTIKLCFEKVYSDKEKREVNLLEYIKVYKKQG